MSKKKYEDLYIGIVEDNEDPYKIGRLKVRVEAVYGDQSKIATDDLPWANPNFSYGGIDDRGFFCPIPKNAYVNVMFVEGDPKKPVWIGTTFSHFAESGSPIPPGEALTNYNDRHVWKTGKCSIIMDDKEESITFKCGSSFITIAPGGINIMHKSGAYVMLNGGVTIYPSIDSPAVSSSSIVAPHAPCLGGGSASCQSPYIPENANEGPPEASYEKGSRSGWSGLSGDHKSE